MVRKREINPKIMTSIRISQDFYKLCKEHHIVLSDALVVGISVLLAEKGVKEYNNKLNIYRRMIFFKNQFEKISQDLYDLEEKLKKQNKNN